MPTSLNTEDHEFLLKAPLLVCILIAGADGDIDRNEIREAIAHANKRQKNATDGLKELYREIGEDFEDKLKILLQSYPIEVTQRNSLLVEELSQLNQVLPKLNNAVAVSYYESICDLAMKVAKSSGGIFGMKSIGEAEARYVKLPMIKNPAANG